MGGCGCGYVSGRTGRTGGYGGGSGAEHEEGLDCGAVAAMRRRHCGGSGGGAVRCGAEIRLQVGCATCT